VIRTLPAFRSRFPDLLYAIAGDGEERAPLENRVRELGVSDSVQFLGEISDGVVLRCYQQCDLFVLANRRVGDDFEGFGIVLLEGQACARPVIAGDSGGTSETMNAPHTGRVVNCNGPESLTAAIGELLADAELRERMGQASRRWVVEQFDWAALTRKADWLFDENGIDFLPRK
jgi:phosphatidylinositol alpha-1,6-mannosyltransferase